MSYPSLLHVGDRSYAVEYSFSLRLSSSVKIKKDKVIVKLSRLLREREREKIVEKFLRWASNRFSKVAVDEFVFPEYKNGGVVCVHNKTYNLRVVFRESKRTRVVLHDDGMIEIFLFEGLELAEKKRLIRFLSEKMIMKDQLPYLKEVLDELNQLYFREHYVACRFKRISSRFGSCSSKRNINIAYRLLFAPRVVFRYVCLHELAHLKELNHSSAFWKLVADAMPDYKKAERWLKDNGFMLG